MKIAIYHNLEKGGALNLLTNVVQKLNKKNTVDLYCHQLNTRQSIFNKVHLYKLKRTSNIAEHIRQVFFELRNTNKKIALDINKGNYDLVLVFQCILTQSPYLLKFLNKNTKSIYILNEPKREFYEKTTFDHFSFKRTIARLIRLPIKLTDQNNCKYAKLIISNSYYSFSQILKVYKKKSFVVYLGLEFIKPKKITTENNRKFISTGQFLKIKGHTFSINQLKNYVQNLTIIGHRTDEYQKIKVLSIKNSVHLNIISTYNNQRKNLELKKHSTYLANNENEPFGITTMEAANNNLFVLGKNQGGTGEIIQNGLNGILYPDNLECARLEIKKLLKLKYITFYKTSKTHWQSYTNKIIQIFNNYYA